MPCLPTDPDFVVIPQINYHWRNFVQTIDYVVPSYYSPTTLEELVWIVHRAEVEGRRLKATGSRWSIENIATSRDWIVDLSNLTQRLRSLLEGTGARALTEATRRRTDELVHIEAGVKLIDLNRRLGPDRAMVTLGGAQGQTLAGAFSTGTHGSDFEHPPLPDLIEAIHLVTTNGEEVWIESSSNPLTDDDDLLLATLPCAETRIIRDDAALNAVRSGMGRFGVIYACVVRVTDSFRLSEYTQYLNWSEVSATLASGIGRPPGSPQRSHLGPVATMPSLDAPPWDLRIDTGDVSAGEFRYFDLAFNTRKMDQCWVRRRWLTRQAGDINLEASDNPLCHPTVANLILAATLTALGIYAGALGGSVVFAWKALEISGYINELAALSLDPHISGGRALAAAVNAINRSELFGGELDWLIDEISQEALAGTFGPSMTEGKRGSNWQVTSGIDETAFRPDCYNGSSIEITFGLQTRAYLDFIEDIRANAGRFVQLGYVSVRFSRGSKATLAMHHVDHPMACAIEVVSLDGLSGTEAWLQWLLARGVELGGRPHWGQKNDLRSWEVAELYGEENLASWREQLLRIAGTSRTFSNEFTVQRGLEPLGVRRRVTAVRNADGAITHLCNDDEYWSPVPVEVAAREILFAGVIYFVTTPEATLERPVVVRQVLTTAADDSTANNLESLPDATLGLPSPDPGLVELRVTSVNRSEGVWPTIRSLCNDTQRWCVSRSMAFMQVRAGTHHYYIEDDAGARTEILARQYLTTEADGSVTNNLDSLPEC